MKEVKVRFGRTIHLGHFETARLVVEESAVITDNNPGEVIEAVFQELKRKVDLKVESLRQRGPAS